MQRVAVLGTGIMGAPIARNLADAGFDVRVWNRTVEKAEAVADDGAELAATPGDAADGADALITMLADGAAVDAVVGDPSQPLSALADGGVWIQTSTVGLEWIERLAARASEAGVAFVDAPVLGTRQPAERGELTVLAAGPPEVLDRCQRVFDAIGSRTHRLGSVGTATRLKLVLNSWIVALVSALAEAVALAEGLGVAPEDFLDVIEGGPLGPAYARIKGDAMVAREYLATFPLELALKDARLVSEAAEAAGVDVAVVQAVVRHMSRAVEAGHGRDDMAAVVETLRRR